MLLPVDIRGQEDFDRLNSTPSSYGDGDMFWGSTYERGRSSRAVESP